MSKRFGSERGAAAVEFALIVPILLLLLIGIIEFGRVYNAQIELTGAAREGVRVMAIQNNPVSARSATRMAAPSLNPALMDSQIGILSSPANTGLCVPGSTVTLTATYPLSFLTGMFGASINLTGRGVMRCGG
ncbi:MAG: pilus assembly protein [Actinomycetota bacterium]|nr:pilus assembly protein [Actinomycetota bacterium]